MDESIDDFQENFKLIKEKKQKLAQIQISKYLSPSQPNRTEPTTSTSQTNQEPKSTKPSLSKLNSSIQKTSSSNKKQDPKATKSTISKYFASSSSQLSTSSDFSAQAEAPKPEAFSCPLCSTNLTSLNEADRQKHVNQCLDQDYSKPNKNKFKPNTILDEDTDILNVPQKPTTSKAVEEVKSEPRDEEAIKKKLNEELLKEAVPNCPICGQVLQSFSVIINIF